VGNVGSDVGVCELWELWEGRRAHTCTPESQNGDGSKFEESTRAAAG
jgi:hypothetical protein